MPHILPRSPRFPLRRPDLPRNHTQPLLHRLPPKRTEGASETELAREPTLALLEAVLFAADEPLTVRRLASLVGLSDVTETRKQVVKLRELYDRDGTAFQVEELAGGFQLLTRPEYHSWLARLRREAPDLSLSAAARETLTIVAYQQPVTRAALEAIRGVSCAEVLRVLMERGLVRIAGRDESLGRPQLYGTTKKFLQVFGLRSLRDLPPAEGVSATSGRGKKPAPEEPG
jgi:segregation and condensation protein B